MGAKLKRCWLRVSLWLWLRVSILGVALWSWAVPAEAQESLGSLAQGQWVNEFKGFAVGLQYLFWLGGAGVFGWGLWKLVHHREHGQETAGSYVRLLVGGALMLGFGFLIQVISLSLFATNTGSTGLGGLGIANP